MNNAVPFNGTAVVVGTAITQTNSTTFTLGTSGVYRVSFILRTTALSLLGSAQVKKNGSTITTAASILSAGIPLIDSVTFNANASDTVQVVVGGLAVTLSSGLSASITIDRISP